MKKEEVENVNFNICPINFPQTKIFCQILSSKKIHKEKIGRNDFKVKRSFFVCEM